MTIRVKNREERYEELIRTPWKDLYALAKKYQLDTTGFTNAYRPSNAKEDQEELFIQKILDQEFSSTN